MHLVFRSQPFLCEFNVVYGVFHFIMLTFEGPAWLTLQLTRGVT